MADNTYNAALAKAMSMCAVREQCIMDIRNKLTAWNTVTRDIEKIIQTLVRENFINEERYATAFVKDKFNYNKWGKVKIAAHLKARNIPAEIIKKALGSINNDTYKDTLRGLITIHSKRIKAKNRYDLKARLLRFGLSKGFESEMLYDLLNDIE